MNEIGELVVTPRETGAAEVLRYQTRDITIDHPYAVNSIERPEKVTLQTYIWQNNEASYPK